MADKDWPSFWHVIVAFIVGFACLIALYLIVRSRVDSLHKKGDTKYLRDKMKHVALSPTIAGYEQILFYFAAISGRDVFGFAVGGWLVFKGISNYALWKGPKEGPEMNTEFLREKQLEQFLEDAARDHNRLQIFLIGTLMSVSAGIAGAVYHGFLHLLAQVHCF